jgi:hypothetical protein
MSDSSLGWLKWLILVWPVLGLVATPIIARFLSMSNEETGEESARPIDTAEQQYPTTEEKAVLRLVPRVTR